MNFINKFKFKNNFSSRKLSKFVLAHFLHKGLSTKTHMLNNRFLIVYMCVGVLTYVDPICTKTD